LGGGYGGGVGPIRRHVFATQQYLTQTGDMEKTLAFAKNAVETCEEYVFLENCITLPRAGGFQTGLFSAIC